MIIKFPDGQRVNMSMVGAPTLVTAGIEFISPSGTILATYNPGSPYLTEAFLSAIDQAAHRGEGFLDLSVLFAVTIISVATMPAVPGATITVTGTGFKTGAKVFIGGQLVPGIITVASANSLSFVAPDNTLEPFLSVFNQKNPTDMMITNTDGTSGAIPAVQLPSGTSFGW